jgi:hypothetical protein
MSQTVETNYTGEDYLELHDSLSGAVMTLKQSLDRYIDTLGEYIAGESVSEIELEHTIELAVDSLERVYSSLDSLDEMLEDENMVARIQRDGKKGHCDLEQNLERLSDGIYSEIKNLNDLLILFDYVDRDSFKADEDHLASADSEIDAPTKMIHNRERIDELKQELNTQYNRLIYSEILARRHTESELTFDPEPPISRLLGHPEHQDRINKLNNQMEKER